MSKSKYGAEVFKDGVVVRNRNRRIVIKKHKRLRGVALQIYSINNDKTTDKRQKHVFLSERMGMRCTGMGLSFEAIKDLAIAISLYNRHIESIEEETWAYHKIDTK